MRGVGHGRHRDQPEQPEQGTALDHRGAHGGYLGGEYPASPPPAEAPATGPDARSADPYYRRPDYPTDPSGIALPELSAEDEETGESPG